MNQKGLKHQLNETERVTKKQASNICCLQEVNFKYKNTDKLKVKGWRMAHRTNTKKKSWSNYTNFKQFRLQNKENYQG